MKVTLLQTDIQWAAVDANIRRADELLARHAGSDLYVLPEMWSTGFATEPQGIALPESENPAKAWMQQTAQAHRCAVCGSLAVVDGDGTFRNRSYFCTPEGVSHYDKHHLFSYGHEDRFYTAGNGRTVVEYGGWRFLLVTCYDLRFPVWSRYTQEQPFDAIVVVANWPESRQTAWRVLTQARAIENQAYLIGVNRVGDDPYSHYVGESVVVSPRGDIVSRCQQTEQALTVDLDLDKLRTMRERFRVLNDADRFTLHL
ncbi:MAG: nitrilase family protein [Prevotella sp.]|nr:nitrilase family protein [Prevotella sp.]